MINIVEKKPEKLSGITSLFVSFDFKPEIVTVIKMADKAVYNKSNYTWELPLTSLAYLLDELTYLDDITLTLYKEEKEEKHYYPKLTYKTKPFKHQLEAIEYGLNTPSWLLLDVPGLGKTATVIDLAAELKEQKGLQHCLVICGVNTLKTNWKNEIKKHSDLSCRVLGEKISKNGKISYASVKERAQELLQPMDSFFIITNIETVRNDVIIEALKNTKNKIDMVVVDEIHRCSNQKSTQGHNLLKLKNYEYKIGLTGTLLTNSPLTAYLPLRWIGKENATFTNFKGQYCEFGGFGNHQIVGYKNINILKDVIESCSLRRTKDLLDLPPKVVIKEVVEMNDIHRRFYENVKDGIKAECDKVELKANNVLALMTRLRQATACPSALTTENIPSSKLERAVELTEDIVSQGDKVVIMSNFKESVYELEKALINYKPLLIEGDMKDDECYKNKELFQTNPDYKVLICTYAKASVGLTLNAANYMICIDERYTYADNLQAQDRIHRMDNDKKTVFIYYLICQNTVDERVDEIADLKKDLSDFIIDDSKNDDLINRLREIITDL